MEFDIKKMKLIKSQSILEYLIVLAAIIIAIAINTIGFRTGVRNSLGLQNSLNTTQNAIETGVIRKAAPPQTAASEPYYSPPREITSNPNNTDQYGGPEYPKGTDGYDYDTWVKNNPNSADNARPAGDSVPQPGVGSNAPAAGQ